MHPFLAAFADELTKVGSPFDDYVNMVPSSVGGGRSRDGYTVPVKVPDVFKAPKTQTQAPQLGHDTQLHRTVRFTDPGRKADLPAVPNQSVAPPPPAPKPVRPERMLLAKNGMAAFAGELAKLGAARALASRLTPESSNVRGYSYDPSSQALTVTFKSGGTYRYNGVPAGVAKALGRNKSTGRTINKLVKAKGYSYEKIGADLRTEVAKALLMRKLRGREVRDLGATSLLRRPRAPRRGNHLLPVAGEFTAKFGPGEGLPKVANGDMLQYFQDHPDKLKAKLERDRKKKLAKHAAATVSFFSSSRRSFAKAAGAAKRQMRVFGLTVKVEHDPGDIRSGTSRDGKTWERTMYAHYGYIPGTKGMGDDGDAIDVYVADDPVDGPVFEVDQQKKGGGHDEMKYMVGYPSLEAAKSDFLRHMPEWAFGKIKQVADSAREFSDSFREEAA